MRNIVSIQSTVLNDKVGNHAARSILSDKGYNIYEIPTVILTSHKAVKGTLQINNNSLNPWVIFNKVRKTYKLSLNDLTIIGYTPNSKISKSIGKIINLQNRIVLDPVMGDIGIGLYVEKDVANFFKKVITKVKYISANFFEWSYLNNKDVKNYSISEIITDLKSEISLSKPLGVTRACISSSILTDGEQAQLPKQYTGSKKIKSSLVDSPKSTFSDFLACTSSSLEPIAWQASDLQICTLCRPTFSFLKSW